MTALHVTSEVDEFAAAAQGYLLTDPVRHTIQLTVLARLRSGPGGYGEPPRFGWLTDDDDVIAAATWTPPFRVAVATTDPSHAAALAAAFPDAGGVIGGVEACHAFAAALSRRTTVIMTEMQYRLDELIPPAALDGSPRRVTSEADIDHATQWYDAFVTETGVTPDPAGSRTAVLHRLSQGTLWFWERDGRPVSMSGYADAPGDVPRVGPVYTPPDQRGHGYAAALTAAVCQHAFDNGAVAVTLFTDADNPVSNSVYLRIGFRKVADIVDLRFDDATAASGSRGCPT